MGNVANDYAGDTSVAAGTLVLGANQVIPSGAGSGDVALDGTLDLNGKLETINGLSGSGTITNSASGRADLTVCGQNVNRTFTFDGHIEGQVNLFKALPQPVFVLAQPNGHTGTMTIQAGTLRIGTNNALPPTSSSADSTLTFDASAIRNVGHHHCRADGNVTLGDKTTLSVTLSGAGSTLNTAGLILGSTATDSTTNSFDLAEFGNPVRPVIHATNLTVVPCHG